MSNLEESLRRPGVCISIFIMSAIRNGEFLYFRSWTISLAGPLNMQHAMLQLKAGVSSTHFEQKRAFGAFFGPMISEQRRHLPPFIM